MCMYVRIVEKRFLFILYIQQPAGNFQCTAPWLHYTFSSLVSSCTDVPRTNETELTERERESEEIQPVNVKLISN